MSTFNRRLQRIEAATGDQPKSVGEMSDKQLIRFIFSGDGSQHITVSELQQIINEPRRANERD